MSRGARRLGRVWRAELRYELRRPLVLILLLMVILSAWALSSGHMRISSGDQTVGGKRAWITSEHSNAFGFCFMTVLFYAFFVSVAAGTTIGRDDELRVSEMLHTSGLRPREYVWAKFGAVLTTFLVVLLVQIVAMAFCQHLLPLEEADKIRGPFALRNYLRPALGFSVPMLAFLTGITFWLGERTRRPVVVFLFPVGVMLVCSFLFWEWNPSWLDPRMDRVLMLLDPTGYRWLNNTLLLVDRGSEYYNTQPVRFDAGFLLSRLAFVALGLGAVAWTERHFVRGLRAVQVRRAGRGEKFATTVEARPDASPSGLASLTMRAAPVGFLRQVATIARFEARELASSAGLYLFAPLILLQSVLNAYYAEGVWGTQLIVTSGTFAIDTFNSLSLCTVLLLLFYTVESVDREAATGLAPVYRGTPVRNASILFGKALANCFVGLLILAAAGLGALLIMLLQGRVRPQLVPFLVVWGLLLVPTLLFWTAFVMATWTVVRNKYTTYGIALGVLILTGILQVRDKMNWVWNWNLWGSALWSDMGLLEPNGWPLLWNRLLYIGMAVLCTVIAVRFLPRRELDATRIVHRMAPASVLRQGLRLLPYAVAPVAIAIFLGYQVADGFQSKRARLRDREYWKHNLATWKDRPKPGLTHVDLDLSLEPQRHSFHNRGAYTLFNPNDEPVRQIALTLGRHIAKPTWTLNGAAFTPEDRAGLYVFELPTALARADTVRIGFDCAGKLPDGITRNGRGLREFIEPSGVVLTSLAPTFTPVVGFMEDIGVDPKENRYEPRVYPDDWYRTVVPPPFGLHRPFTTRIRIDAPAEYRLNSVGTLARETIENGRRHAVWVSDHPVNLFNVVAGKWAERKGDGTVIYYHPTHTYNLDEMSWALDGARQSFSTWFHPYPWQELKLSQFPGLARYAQGFPTNITFSEDIGFRMKSDRRSRAAFTVTAHEAAHQWWGNLLVPGEGPGGDLLSEGMAHFSTLLLHEAMNGPQGRIEFAKRIEERYNNARQVDAERPLVKIDDSKEGDQTVLYDKGGWVFWMLYDRMGSDPNLAGLRAFLANHMQNPDHPLLEDFVDEMRPFASDSTAYNGFVRQWFFEVVVPEYQLRDLQREKSGDGWVVTGKVQNAGTGRMPFEIAAVHGERFAKQTEAEAKAGPAPVASDYREARSGFELGAGEAADFRIECAFEPQSVVVDPDVRVLQLRRKHAVHRF